MIVDNNYIKLQVSDTFLVAVVVVFLIVIIIYNWNQSQYRIDTMIKYLDGFWQADENFSADAGIQNMLLYLQGRLGDSELPGYIVMTSDSNNIDANMSIIIGKVKQCGDVLSTRAQVLSTGDQEVPFPDVVDLEINPLTGTCKIHRDGVIFAALYKRHDITEFIAQNIDN